MYTAADIEQLLKAAAIPEKIKILSYFFKTGKGQYGEGDQFLSVPVPKQHEIVKQVKGEISLTEIEKLLQSPFHECRMTALLLLVWQYQHTKNAEVRQQIFDFYLSHTEHINNWDLVDLSAPKIVGEQLRGRSHELLFRMAESSNIWEQRIAIVSTQPLIRSGQLDTTLRLAEQLLHHPHDLLQKAVGWMLREVGKQDFDLEYRFLTENNRYKTMPRTMLRYAIEKFPEPMRKKFLEK